MNYALQISAHGALTAMYRSDVIANNLANYATDAFKPDVPMVRERAVVRVEDGLAHLPSNVMLERLGAGPHLAPNVINFTQGAVDTTENPLDLAILGHGFFQVAVGDGTSTHLTRDGRLQLDQDNRLVQAASGHQVLDTRGRPVYISREGGPVDVDASGVVRQGDVTIAQLALVDLPDRRHLVRKGAGLFIVPADRQDGLRPAPGRLQQGALEKSGVNEISTLKDLTDAFGAVGANTRMMMYADDMLDRAINRLGRVA